MWYPHTAVCGSYTTVLSKSITGWKITMYYGLSLCNILSSEKTFMDLSGWGSSQGFMTISENLYMML